MKLNEKMLNSHYFHDRDDNHSKNAQLINDDLTLVKDSKAFEKEIHIFFYQNLEFFKMNQLQNMFYPARGQIGFSLHFVDINDVSYFATHFFLVICV